MMQEHAMFFNLSNMAYGKGGSFPQDVVTLISFLE
jgi:hypothetical protein